MMGRLKTSDPEWLKRSVPVPLAAALEPPNWMADARTEPGSAPRPMARVPTPPVFRPNRTGCPG